MASADAAVRLKREAPDDDSFAENDREEDDVEEHDEDDEDEDEDVKLPVRKIARTDSGPPAGSPAVKEEEEEEDEDEDEDEEEEEGAEKTEKEGSHGEVARREEAAGNIEFKVVINDGESDSMRILTGCKMIFQKQLPKMPKEYITRLVYDWRHKTMALVRDQNKVIGAITYRPFESQAFAEIVFCAIHSDNQVRGYGSLLMNHLKAHLCQENKLHYFLTYADNYAVGYFKKQGFTAEITLDRAVWGGYIKDYEGGTLMQCSIIPNIDYLRWRDIVREQKEVVNAHIQTKSSSHVVFPKIEFGRKGSIAPEEVPGVQGRWTDEMKRPAPPTSRDALYAVIRRTLKAVKQHRSAWPFRDPVKRDEVPDYYDVIKNPMDLRTAEGKVEARAFRDLKSFEDDIFLITANSKTYNEATTPYYKCAVELETFFRGTLDEMRASYQQILSSLGLTEK